MAKNHLLIYPEQLATDIELLCQKIKFDETEKVRKGNKKASNMIKIINETVVF